MANLCIFLTFLFLVRSEAARILFAAPTPALSHQLVFRPIVLELIKKHEVVYLTTHPIYKENRPDNLTEIDLHDISYKVWKDFNASGKGKTDFVLKTMGEMFEVFTQVCGAQFQQDVVKNLIKDQRGFDLLIIEGWVNSPIIWSHFFHAPVVLINSMGAVLSNRRIIGSPIHPFIHHVYASPKGFNLTWWEKIKELALVVSLVKRRDDVEAYEDDSVKEWFGDVPSLMQLENNVDLMLLNTNPVWEDNPAVPPSVVYIGGVKSCEGSVENLPEDLKSYLDRSTKGVIYVSFGTNVHVSLLPQDKIQVFVRVLSRLPYDVLWKWDAEDLPGRSRNMRVGRWFPQVDLLRHPKIKLFITQAGLQSTDEAIAAGVPLLGLPLLGDQWHNAKNYEKHRVGLAVDIAEVTEEEVERKILEIVGDDSYRENIRMLRSRVKTSPVSGMDSAISWIERALKRTAGVVRAPNANMGSAEYFEFELLFICLLSVVVMIFVWVLTILFVFKSLIRYIFKVKVS